MALITEVDIAKERDTGKLRGGSAPEKAGLSLKLVGIEPICVIAFVPAIVFPFLKVTWMLSLVGLIGFAILNYFKLPPAQVVRFLRQLFRAELVVPVPEQNFRQFQETRPWPY